MYTKQALTIDEQIGQLRRSVLTIDQDAVHFLLFPFYYLKKDSFWRSDFYLRNTSYSSKFHSESVTMYN